MDGETDRWQVDVDKVVYEMDPSHLRWLKRSRPARFPPVPADPPAKSPVIDIEDLLSFPWDQWVEPPASSDS